MKSLRLGLICLLVLYTHTIFNDTEQQQPDNQTDLKNFEQTAFGWTETFAKVMQLTHDKHYNPANLEQAMIKAISAFLNNLDPHSDFLDPDTYTVMLKSISGEFFGIGVVIDNTRKSKDKFLLIIDTIPDGPADKVGIIQLDKIIEVDGKSLEGMTTDQATSILKGERNTPVRVKVLRENHQDLLQFDITRDVIKEQNSLAFHIKDQNIYYLSLSMFTEAAVKQIEDLLKQAQTKQYKGLILDLRNNSGGLLSAAIDISGLFLDKESLVVVIKDKDNKEIERYATTRNPISTGNTPIFILINNYTASAAEILAGTLKVHANKLNSQTKQNKPFVFLAGTTTFGKGSVQEVIPVSNNSAIKLTTSLYYLPDDTTIQGTGIEPDFAIEKSFGPPEQMKWFTQFYGRENTLENYIKPIDHKSVEVDNKNNQKESDQKGEKEEASQKPSRWQERATQMLQSDNQLRETITLINILDTAQKLIPEQVDTQQKATAFIEQNVIGNKKLQIEEIKI